MRKIIITVLLTILAILVLINNNTSKSVTPKETEYRGVFYSYLEFQSNIQGKDSNSIKKEVDNVIQNMKDNHLNMLLLHVRPFADAIYDSFYFPYSRILTGSSDKKLDFDILEYFIEKAHAANITVHAWINPYRISNTADISVIKEDTYYYKWTNTECIKVIEDKGVFFNPSCSEVRTLIVKGVEELINSYKVDGIIFDDYFYPSQEIDLVSYLTYQSTGGQLTLSDYRLLQVNTLIEEVYKTVKKKDSNLLFGISPEGNINNNYELNYADTKKWASVKGYVDYLMPQIYFGFENERRPYLNTLDEWNNLFQNDIFMIPALAFYKVGQVDNYAKAGSNEWINNHDIIKKQVLSSRLKPAYKGFSLFRYNNLLDPNNKEELNNLQSILKEDA